MPSSTGRGNWVPSTLHIGDLGGSRKSYTFTVLLIKELVFPFVLFLLKYYTFNLTCFKWFCLNSVFYVV